MATVVLECGCWMQGAEAEAVAELAEDIKLTCPNCQVPMRITLVVSEPEPRGYITPEDTAEAFRRRDHREVNPKYWPDGEPITPWSDPWHDVLGDIRQFKADASEHRDDPYWPSPPLPDWTPGPRRTPLNCPCCVFGTDDCWCSEPCGAERCQALPYDSDDHYDGNPARP